MFDKKPRTNEEIEAEWKNFIKARNSRNSNEQNE